MRAGRSLTPKVWPNGARVAVALTFNVSNSANQLARGDTAVVAMTGGEFGAVQGLARVLELLDRHDVPATFFVAGVADLVDPQMVPEIAKRKRHELGVLGWSDENVAALNDAAEESRLLMRAIERVSAAAGRKPAGARGPSGTVSLHTMGLLKKAGILYDSSLQARDEPYEVLLQGQAIRHRRAAEQPVSQRSPLSDVGPHRTRAAAVAGADLRDVPGRLRCRLRGRHAVRSHAAPARGRHAIAHHLPRCAGSLHQGETRRLVRDGRRDCALRQAAGKAERLSRERCDANTDGGLVLGLAARDRIRARGRRIGKPGRPGR